MSKGEQTRQFIVREAAAIFNQHGFEGASMSALQSATGLEKGGLYRHFSSKEELALQAFDYAWREAGRARAHGIDEASNSVDQLKVFISNFVHRRPSVPGGCPLLNTAVDSDDGNDELRKRASAALRQWFRLLRTIIGKGIDVGEIRASVNANELATIIISSLEGALVISRLERKNKALLAVEAHLCKFLETQVRASHPRSP